MFHDLSERKQLENFLSQETSGFVIVDQAGTVCFVNPAAEKILNRSAATLIGNTFDLPVVFGKTTEVNIAHSIVEIRVVETEWEKQAAYLVSLRNITEYKRLEDLLKQSEARYRAIIEEHSDLVCRFLPDTTLTFINDACCDYFARRREEVLGNSFLEFIPKTFHQAILTQIQKIVINPITASYDYPVIDAHQEIRWVQWKNRPILDETERVIEFQVVGRDLTERRQAEKALQQAYERFTTILDSLDSLVYVADMQTYEILFVNQYAKNIFYDKDLVGRICWQVLQKGQKQPCEFCTNNKLVDSNGEPTGLYVWEFQNTITQHWFYIQNRAIRWTDGRLVRLETATDITKRKQIEAALQKSEARLVEAQRIAHLGCWEWDIIIGKELWSNEMFRILGLSSQTACLTHETFEKALHPEDYEYVMQAFEKAITQGTPYQIAFRVVWLDGTVRFLQAFGELIRDAKGKPLRLVGTAQDITELKLIENALRDSEARYRSVVIALREGIVLHNERGVIYECNPSAERILGLSRSQLIGRTPAEPHWLMIHEDGTPFSCDTHPVIITLRTGLPVSDVVMGLCKPNGILWLSINSQPLISYRQALFEYHSPPDDIDKCRGVVASFTDITERKRAEDQLWRSQQRYKTLATASPVGLFETDVEGFCMYVNDQTCQILQRSVIELIGMRWIHSLHPNDREDVFVEWQQSVEQKEKYYRECRFQRPDGEVVWVIGQIAPSFDTDDRLEGFVGTLTDITKLKRTEEQLQVAEAQYQMLIECVPAVIYTASVDERNNFFYISPQVEILLEFTPNDWLTREGLWCEQIHHRDREWVREKHLATLAGDQTFEAEYRLLKRTGETIWVHDEAIIRRDRDERPQVVQGVLMDITKRKQAEEALRESERYRRALIEESQVGLGIFGLDGKIGEVNSAFARILGYSVEEIVNKLCCQDITPMDYTKTDREQVAILKRTGRFGPYEKEFIHKNGYLVLVKLSGLLITHHEKPAIWVNIEDITEQKRIEEALRNAKEKAEVASHAKTAFLTNMSHELRTPLNSILGYTQILKRDKALSSEQREGIDVIHRSSEYLLTLINDILDLAKIEADRVELYPTDIQFIDFIKSIVELFKTRAKEKELIFDYEELSLLPPIVHADEKRLRQILVNLLSNAFKFTKQGHVRLKIGVEGESLDSLTEPERKLQKIRFEVEDTGIGIAAEDIESIFMPFQQVGEKNYQSQGTGLGLSITKKLVELMGGKLQVTSIVGVGSLFWTTLELITMLKAVQSKQTKEPLIVGYRIPSRMTTPYSVSPEKSKIKILIVDDSHENRLTLVNFLVSLGFEVVEAEDGLSGIEKTKILKDVDVILMDLVMPVIDGLEATRQIKRLPELKDVIIIAVSASIFDYHQQQSIDAGCNDFIPKPIRTEVLLDKLQKHLNLEWIYETEAKPQLSSTLEQSMVALSTEQAEQLLHLAMMGDVYGILEYSEKLKQENENLTPFTAKITRLAKRFRTDEICAITQRLLDDRKWRDLKTPLK